MKSLGSFICFYCTLAIWISHLLQVASFLEGTGRILRYTEFRSISKLPDVAMEDKIFNIRDLEEYSSLWGVNFSVSNFLNYFKVTASKTNNLTGKVEDVGFVNAFTVGNLLHLETAQIRRKNSPLSDGDLPWIKHSDNGFQLGAVLGCYAMRLGYEKGCTTAELLAIYDSERHHQRLVKYYKIAGFTPVAWVGDSLKDVPSRMLWGGEGTLMRTDIIPFMIRWRKVVKKEV